MKFKLLTIIFCMPFFIYAQTNKQKSAVKTKPNIIFILADDLGIGNVSCYGADNYATPNIDKLAKEGVRFNHMYTAPLCGPSRAMILTGRYAFKTGATNQDATGLMKKDQEKMIPSFLNKAGYISTSTGKWGQLPLEPVDFGFDDYLKFKGSGVYKNNAEKKYSYTVNGEEKLLKDSEYMPDLMHNHLQEFIIKNKDNRFFAYYPMSHVHGTIVATPDSKPDSKDLFADNVLYMDKLVGNLMNLLDSLKIRDNTIVFFMGDNGTANQWAKNSTINNKQLSGKKGEMKECGGLVPMIANWPGYFSSGIVSDQLLDASDILPTIIELAGAKIPGDRQIDGRSFASNLLGKSTKEREWIFCELGNKWYVRNKSWKLNNDNQFFDMKNAPFEEALISAENIAPDAAIEYQKLKKVLDQLSPEKGIIDNGDGSGRHGSKLKNKNNKVDATD